MNRLVCNDKEFEVKSVEHDEGNYRIVIFANDEFSPSVLEGLERVGVLDEVNAGVYLEMRNYENPIVVENEEDITIEYRLKTVSTPQDAIQEQLDRLLRMLNADSSEV